MINKDILADLDDLDDGDQSQHQMQEQQNDNLDPIGQQLKAVKLQQYGVNNIAAQKHSRLLTLNRQKFMQHINQINQRIDQKIEKCERSLPIPQCNKSETIEEITKSNNYALEISREIASITKYVQSIYQKKLPQLQSTVPNPVHYCKALLQIEQGQNQFKYLTPHQRISLSISVSGPREQLAKQDRLAVIEAAGIVIQLQAYYQTLMIFLETSMQVVAPNLCQLVGSSIAAKLIAIAGGVDKLAAMPACNIQVMGGSRSAQVGLSQLQRNHTGIFGQMEVVRDAPERFRMKLVRMLATNTAKCARADYLGSNQGQGAKLREQMYQRFEKVQEEGGLLRTQKPLDIPDMQPKKKRGGKRHRKMKQLYEMSQLRKQQNRTKFGQAQQQIEQGVGLGMLKAGTGKLKVNIKKQKLKLSKKMQERANKKSGLESSLNLNARQGIQLINPALKDQRSQNKSSGTQSYFAKQAGFRTILNNKLNK